MFPREQLGDSDHKPVHLTISSEVVVTDHPHPRWDHIKANWGLFTHRTNTLNRNSRVEGRDLYNVVKDFNTYFLQAANESIPRGERKEYRRYCSNDLQILQNDLNETRIRAEEQPSKQNHEQLQQAKAKFIRTTMEAAR